MPCTDVSADVKTKGRLVVGQDNLSNFELCGDEEATFDTDWHSVRLEYGKTYLFYMTFTGTAPTIQPSLTLADRSGFSETRMDDSGQLYFRHTARYSGRHFVSAFQGTLLTGTEYNIHAVEINDDTKSTGPTIRLLDGYAKQDAIEVVGDTDTFDFEVRAGRSYSFIVEGANGTGTLPNSTVELRRGNQLIGNGPGYVKFVAGTRETLQLVVGGAGGTGTYSVIGLVDDDAAAGTATTSELTFNADGLASKTGYISEYMDFDWHKVDLNENDIVKVSLRGNGVDFLRTPNLIFRDTTLAVIQGKGLKVPSTDGDGVDFYYKVKTTGSHYVVARTKRDSQHGGYEVAIEKVRTPAMPNHLFGRGPTSRLLVDDAATIPLSQMLNLQGLDPFSYEVYSSVPLIRDGNVMAANNTYGIIAANIGLWSVKADQVLEDGDLMMRARVSSSWSEWQKFAISRVAIPDKLDTGDRWAGNDPVTFRFVKTRPSEYGASEFGDFRVISAFAGIGRDISNVIDEFNMVNPNRQLVAAADGVDADINIFAVSNLGTPYLSYAPGTGRGGDLIFNQSDFSGDVTPLQKFRVARAFGHALGLGYVDALSRENTVMGSFANSHPKGYLPTNFGTADWNALRTIYGSGLRDPLDTETVSSEVVLDNEDTIQTISYEARRVIVGNDVKNLDFNVDLRDGGRSYARNGQSSEAYLAQGALVFVGVGGDGDDFIFGNGLKNELHGGGGRDFLTGFENDDRLFGGAGDDVYLHYFGDGNDFISDVGGGVDTLCFLGRGPFEIDRLFEDYLFSRDGNFLDVSLTLDGGEQDGSVRIDTGLSQGNVIETLELWHAGALRERISLFSIWSELSDGQTSRFNLLTTSDNFGKLAAPA